MSDFSEGLAKARAHLETGLIARASSDPAFRALLKADPHAALRDLMGSDPIPSMKIRVIEEAPGEVTLVLPRNIADDELPDELLDLASGGTLFMAFLEYPFGVGQTPCPRSRVN